MEPVFDYQNYKLVINLKSTTASISTAYGWVDEFNIKVNLPDGKCSNTVLIEEIEECLCKLEMVPLYNMAGEEEAAEKAQDDLDNICVELIDMLKSFKHDKMITETSCSVSNNIVAHIAVRQEPIE